MTPESSRSSVPEPSDLEAAEVRILRLQAGDEIVLRMTERVSASDLDDIRAMAQENWPGHKITVLARGMDLEVVRGI